MTDDLDYQMCQKWQTETRKNMVLIGLVNVKLGRERGE